MAGCNQRNIFRAVAIHHERGGMLYDHEVEIMTLTDITGTPLEDKGIRGSVQAWLDDNEVRAAISQDRVIWFAHETDATLFYLRFS